MNDHPIRILLISDTHGDLAIINELAERTRAQAVIHAGDFGFYDRDSPNRLSARELGLMVRHSTLVPEKRQEAKRLFQEGLRSFVRESGLMSDLPLYLDGSRKFDVPVYAVWGNHEDLQVIMLFRTGDYKVENLFILDESHNYHLGRLHIFGLGGNVIPGNKLFDLPVAGERGKVWATLSQMERLRQSIEHGPKPGDIRVMVTHVSPGKEPLLWRLAAHTHAEFSISGHMGAPYCMTWNEFSIREADESFAMIESRCEIVERAWKTRRPHLKPEEERETAELGLKMLRELPEDRVSGGRRGSVPRWTRSPVCINLPDASQGHAVLIVEEEKVSLETYSTGKSFLRPDSRPS